MLLGSMSSFPIKEGKVKFTKRPLKKRDPKKLLFSILTSPILSYRTSTTMNVRGDLVVNKCISRFSKVFDGPDPTLVVEPKK